MPDTNCMVAMLQFRHDHHDRASTEYNRRINRGERPVVATHALTEAYAVLTRMPPSNRLPPQAAWTSLTETFLAHADIVSLDTDAYIAVLQGAPERAIIGGRIYDAIIVECAIRARVDAIVTFNERHFINLAPPSIQIVVPQ